MIFVTNFKDTAELFQRIEEEIKREKGIDPRFMRIPLNKPESLTDELRSRSNIIIILSGDVKAFWLNSVRVKIGDRKIYCILDPNTKSPHSDRDVRLLQGIEVIQRPLVVEQIITQFLLLLANEKQKISH